MHVATPGCSRPYWGRIGRTCVKIATDLVTNIIRRRTRPNMSSPLKKIPIAQVVRGMYIHRICGKWMDHPFWRASFLVTDTRALETLRSLGDKDVWIDTRKGADVQPNSIGAKPAPQCLAPPAPAAATLPVARSGFGEAYVRAKAVRDRAKEVARSLFQDARMGKALSMEATSDMVDEVNDAIASNQTAILSVVRLKNKDDYTYLHSVAVAALMMALGRQLGFDADALKELGMAGLLHDIGKIGVSDAVLNKPGRLTPLEMSSIRLHPQIGWDILKREADAGAVALDVCLHHHEKTDGSGYPERLSGEAISCEARMGAICDVYDAITSDRPYKKGWQPGEAIRRMAEWQEGHFDRRIFHAFVKLIGIYPTGTLVRLQSQRLAVVLHQGRSSSLSPIVRAFRAWPSLEPIEPTLVDLEDSGDAIVGMEDPHALDIDIPTLLRS